LTKNRKKPNTKIMFKGRPPKPEKSEARNRPNREKKRLTKTVAITELHPAPELMNEYAQQEWDRLMRNVSNLIHPQDLGILEIACRAYGLYIMLEEEMQANGRFTTNSNGMTVLSPLARESKRQLEVYQKIVIQFGVTPLSRVKVAIPKKQDEEKPDPMEKLLSML